MKLTQKHLQVYKMISDRGAGRGCSDLEPAERRVLTKSEWINFNRAYHTWNGDLEEFEDSPTEYMMDFAILIFVRHILLESYCKAEGISNV